MKKEEILYKYRESRSPVYSYNQVMKAMDEYKNGEIAEITENLKNLQKAFNDLMKREKKLMMHPDSFEKMIKEKYNLKN